MGLIWIGLGLVALVMGFWFVLLWATSSREGWRP